MNIPPVTKEQKITLLFTAFVIIIFFIFLFWKPSKVNYKETDYNGNLYNSKVIDSLEFCLKKQTELNNAYIVEINNLEKSMDSIKTLITENSKKITIIQKRRTDEKKVNYYSWTDNEFTRFFTNRYQQR